MSYRSLRSVMFTSVSVWCITVRAIFGEGIRPSGKKIYLESIATCQILFSKFGLSKPPLPSTTTLKMKLFVTFIHSFIRGWNYGWNYRIVARWMKVAFYFHPRLKDGWRSKFTTIPQLRIPIHCLNVWTQLALPITRALLYLHGQSRWATILPYPSIRLSLQMKPRTWNSIW
jgi:hypothetical protein